MARPTFAPKAFFRPRRWLIRTLTFSVLFSSMGPSFSQMMSGSDNTTVPAINPTEAPLITSAPYMANTQSRSRPTSSGDANSSLLQIRDNNDSNNRNSQCNPQTMEQNEKNPNLPDCDAQRDNSALDDFENLNNKQQRNTRNNRPPEKNEFQDFITQSVGKKLPIYGRNLFTDKSNTSSSFAPPQNVAVPGDYTIGVGDQIYIRTSGSLDIDYHATVDPNGKISIPHIGSINLAGTRYSEVQSVIQKSMGRLYRNFNLYVSLGQLRSIRVYLVGHVQRPGAYTVSSLSTLVNTLLTAGGPSATGSLRNIQVRRAGKLISDFDMYDLLLKGDKTKDVHLMSEDVIYVGPIGKLIALNGSVNQPAIYEMKDNETLGDALHFGGGLTPVASSDKISIERIIHHKQRTVKQIALSPAALKQPVFEGDLITILDISRKFDNIVTVRGHVARPIRMPWHDNLRIHDVIPSKEALITSEYYENVENLTRKTPKELQLQMAKNKNLESLPSLTSLNRDAKQNGGVRQTNLSNANDNPDDSDTETDKPGSTDIKRIIHEPNFEYAVIERLRGDLSQEIIPFNLGKALKNDPKSNLVLQPNDIVTIFAKDDISVPRSQRSGFVRLEGEFNASGIYRIEPGDTLKQVIERSGGVTNDAYVYAINLERKSARETQKARYNEWLNRMERDLLHSTSTQNAITAEEATIQKTTMENKRSLLERLKTLQPKGRIVFNFKNSTTPQVSDLPDLVLEDGDKIMMPYKPSTVSVIGSVVNDGTFLFRPGKTADDYIQDAGGATEYAYNAGLYIIRADGSVTSSSHKTFLGFFSSRPNFNIMPGDTIILPEKMNGQSLMASLKDIGTILYQFGLGAAAIKVLKN